MSDAKRAARASRRARALLVIASIVLSLLAVELGVRVAPRSWVPELLSYEQTQFHLGHLVQPSENPRLYYELRPDNPQYEVNTDGYRGPLYPLEKPKNVFRIVGLGDSNMFAWQVSEGDGYLRQLETLLNDDPAIDCTTQVINLAVPGYNTGQQRELLRSRALAWEPDLILLGYDHNDPEPIASREQTTYLMPDHYGDNVLHSELLRWMLRRRRAAQWSRSLGDVQDARNELETFRMPDGRRAAYLAGGPLWDEHLAHFAVMAVLLKAARGQDNRSQAGIPVLVVMHDAWITPDPQRDSSHYRRLHLPLHACFAELGWHWFDAYDVLQDDMREHRARDLRRLWVSAEHLDGHPNAEAHRIIARGLRDFIVREQWFQPTTR